MIIGQDNNNKKCLPFRECRQEIEDCICSIILKHQAPSNEKKKSSFHVKPQVFAQIACYCA